MCSRPAVIAPPVLWGNGATGTRPVFDKHLLPKRLGQPTGDDARDHVRRPYRVAILGDCGRSREHHRSRPAARIYETISAGGSSPTPKVYAATLVSGVVSVAVTEIATVSSPIGLSGKTCARRDVEFPPCVLPPALARQFVPSAERVSSSSKSIACSGPGVPSAPRTPSCWPLPISTASAPSAIARTTSEPERTPESISTVAWPPACRTIAGNASIGGGNASTCPSAMRRHDDAIATDTDRTLRVARVHDAFHQ